MRYAPPGLCLNDMAVLSDLAGGYALLHLQGPWTERFDHLRMETSFGRATSTDLVDWRPQGAVFGVGLPGRFDQQAVWTMHPFRHEDGMAMLYTGVRGLTATGWPLQSIGLAYSARTDGTGWLRAGVAPVVEADPRWYRTGDGMGWRDPFIVRDDDDAGWAMVICASDAFLPLERSGCVGLATSTDLEHWTVHPPLISPGDIDQLECPVLERLPDGWLLLGCNNADNRIEGWSAPKLVGPWRRLGVLGPAGAYAPRLITAPDGARVALHTTPRKVGLVDSGAPCRGMLAQPKVLAPRPDGPPRLEWWPGLDTWLGQHTDRVTQHAVGDVAVTGPVEIALRTEGMLRIGCDGRKLWATGPDGIRLRETVLAAPAETLRILTIGEYVEVYADNEFALTVACYTGSATPWTVSTGGRTSTLPVRPVRLPDPARDDVSAVWPGR